MADDWGPLARLAGDWEGEGGLDAAFAHGPGAVVTTEYRERLSFKPFGPVVNGRQTLFGLDYRTAMWRGSEDDPFHTEVGYWLWDGATGEIVRGFVVPRGITVLAGGRAAPDADSFTLRAAPGEPHYTIGENTYLAQHASTLSYEVTITLHDDDSWSYDETTMLRMDELPEPLPHTDRNRLRRVS
jgi:hypothetical protein